MGDVETGKFLGWYFPEENKVPFFITNLRIGQKKYKCGDCCYESDRAYDVRRHVGKMHALVNTNHNNTNNTSNTLIGVNDGSGVYLDKRKQTKLKKGGIIDRGVKLGGDVLHGKKLKRKSVRREKRLNSMGKENGGEYKEGNGILGDEEKYHIIKLFKLQLLSFSKQI